MAGNIKRFKRGRGDSELITASEIACFAYCPEQWRLQYGLELLPANRAALDAGTRYHWWKAIAERIAGGLIGIGRVLIVIALVLLAAVAGMAMIPTGLIAVGAVLALLLGVVLILGGQGMRRRRGSGQGNITSHLSVAARTTCSLADDR